MYWTTTLHSLTHSLTHSLPRSNDIPLWFLTHLEGVDITVHARELTRAGQTRAREGLALTLALTHTAASVQVLVQVQCEAAAPAAHSNALR
jgi:hypothetical protein